MQKLDNFEHRISLNPKNEMQVDGPITNLADLKV